MHAAKLDKSDRLKRTVKAMVHARERGAELSTRGIMREANVCAVNSVISELRANGFNITAKRRGKYWYYSLVEGSE